MSSKLEKELHDICDIIEKEFFNKYSSYNGNEAPGKYIKGAFNEKAFKKALYQFKNGAPQVKGNKKIHESKLLNLSEFYAILAAQIPTRLIMLAKEVWKKLDDNYSKDKKTNIKKVCEEFKTNPDDKKFKSAMYPLNELQAYCNLPKSSKLNEDIIREIPVCIEEFKELAIYMNEKEGSCSLKEKIKKYSEATKKSERHKERIRKEISKHKAKIDNVWHSILSSKLDTEQIEISDSNIKKSLKIVVKKLEKVIEKIADIRQTPIESTKIWGNIIDELVKSLKKAVKEMESILKKEITINESNAVEAIKLQVESYVSELEKLKIKGK